MWRGWWLWWLLSSEPASPLARISYKACLVSTAEEADMMAREVTSVAEARWCVVLSRECKDAIMIYRNHAAEETYVVSANCR